MEAIGQTGQGTGSFLPENPKVVFLDRTSIRTPLRPLGFAHRWFEYQTCTPAEVVPRLEGASIALTNRMHFGEEQLQALPMLKLIAMTATGFDCIDVEACRRHGVAVTNIRNWCTSTVAEHAFALLFALRRQLFRYRLLVQRGEWQRSAFYGLLEDPLPETLEGSTLAVIGYGALGRRIEAIAGALGMHVVVAERRGVEARAGRVALGEALRGADVLCLTCPLTPETRGLIGSEELRLMKPSALLINCARGHIVDDAALAEALRDGRLGGAGLDVLREEPPRNGNPLLDLELPNLIVTPHTAFASREALEVLGEQLIANIEAFAAGEPRNVVS